MKNILKSNVFIGVFGSICIIGITILCLYIANQDDSTIKSVTKQNETVHKVEDKKEINVTIDYDDGTNMYIKTLYENETIQRPDDPVKEGYNFLGWYVGDNEYMFNMPITENTYIVAKWELITDEADFTVVEEPVSSYDETSFVAENPVPEVSYCSVKIFNLVAGMKTIETSIECGRALDISSMCSEILSNTLEENDVIVEPDCTKWKYSEVCDISDPITCPNIVDFDIFSPINKNIVLGYYIGYGASEDYPDANVFAQLR